MGVTATIRAYRLNSWNILMPRPREECPQPLKSARPRKSLGRRPASLAWYPRCPGPCSKNAARYFRRDGSGPCLPSGDPRPWYASGSAAVVNTDPEREDSESTSCTGMGYRSQLFPTFGSAQISTQHLQN